ncbi:membrane-anchored ubiquitin-fold protein 3 isoform X1 [Cajanus cajan]|uniref:membrane-anchored ubiquitin-fold protein 3 isoform X1 n=1 Tax=Cajanus cajan TaxID=3821 RepID=UPI00098D9F0F|nr:membrane-anchored ubiquitin-fold protein 3 isoform X1 [Cajanus cajan]
MDPILDPSVTRRLPLWLCSRTGFSPTGPKGFASDFLASLESLALLFSSDYKKIIPKAANDIKLISAGKILENNKTVGQCRVPFGELPKGVITMHVVVQPSLLKAKTEKKVDEMPRKHICACSIL